MGISAVKLGVIYFYPITYLGWRKGNPGFLDYGSDNVNELHGFHPSHKEFEMAQKKFMLISLET